MRILIASDKFKYSLTSEEVASHLTKGLLAAHPDFIVDSVAMADGGEGTVRAAISAGFEAHTVTVSGPTGQPIDASIAIKGKEAVIEIAAASGLAALPDGIAAPMEASSRGTGQLISAALDLGCTRIFIGAGGSASTDGGAGLLQGLGAKLLTADGGPVAPGGGALTTLATIDPRALHPSLSNAEFILASDVDHPLVGKNGCAAIFGPQKGATAEQVEILEGALTHFVTVLQKEIGFRAVTSATQAGAGAAGGIGYAALAVLGARFESGFEILSGMAGLTHRIQRSALVITGEGSLDEQSLAGKLPVGVSKAAARVGVPVTVVCGRNTLSEADLTAAGFTRTYELMTMAADEKHCMSHAGELLETIGTIIGSELLKPAAVTGPDVEDESSLASESVIS